MLPLALPEPDAPAREHSERLLAHIRQAIAEAGGSIAFSRYMELALYTPGLGYYSAGATKFGVSGDFITAPELGDLFARTLAQACVPVLQELGPEARWLELGGGSGAFAEAALRHWDELGVLPADYAILEPSADLRERQREGLSARLPAKLFSRLQWLDRLPETDGCGVLFANEVLDALPVSRFVIRAGEVWEEHVCWQADGLRRCEQPADGMLTAAVRHLEVDLNARFAEGYRSELLVQLPWWLQAVGAWLQRGLMLLVDYGYPRRTFYLPERSDGSLICHYRHRAHNDPLHWPGLTDISSFVDFTAVAEAGHRAGWELAGYASQAGFLLAHGITELLQRPGDGAQQRRRNEEARRLLLPGEMGERFQVVGLQRGLEAAGLFAGCDRSERL